MNRQKDNQFVPRSWHTVYFIFTFVLPSLKFTIYHSFTMQYDLDIADPSSMHDTCQIWTWYNGVALHEFSVAQVDRVPTRCLGGHRFESCQGLRVLCLSHTCDMLTISFRICFTELKIYHLSFFHHTHTYTQQAAVTMQTYENQYLRIHNCFNYTVS